MKSLGQCVFLGVTCFLVVRAAPAAAPDAANAEQQLAAASDIDAEALALLKGGDFAAALAKRQSSMAIYKAVYGEKDPRYARQIAINAGLYFGHQDVDLAITNYKAAITVFKNNLPASAADYYAAITSLASCYGSQAKYAAALPLLQEVMAYRKETLGNRHPDTLRSMYELAEMYLNQSDLAQAEPLSAEVLTVRREMLGEHCNDFFESLTMQGRIYLEQKNYAKAEPILIAALALAAELFHEEHARYAHALANLAVLDIEMGRAKVAEQRLMQALEIYRQTVGEESLFYANCLNNLARAVQDQSEPDRAVKYYLQAISLDERLLGPRHPKVAIALSNLAGLYFATDEFAQAEETYQRSLAIIKETLGTFHSQYTTTLNNLALLHIEMRRDAQSAQELKEVVELTHEWLESTAAVQSEQEQLESAAQGDSYFQSYLAASFTAQVPPAEIYEHVLQWKGSVTRRQAQMRTLRRALSQNEEAETAFAELEAATRRLAWLVNNVPEETRRAAYEEELATQHERVETLQKKLAGITARVSGPAPPPVTAVEICAGLPVDGALVDFVAYQHFGYLQEGQTKAKSEQRMVAFILLPNGNVEWILLGHAPALNIATEIWRAKYIRQTFSADSPDGEELRHAQQSWRDELGDLDPGLALRQWIWNPLAARIGAARTILISPDGFLGRLAWNALPGEQQGTYLIEEDRRFCLVPIPYLLPAIAQQSRQPGLAPVSLLSVSDVDYGVSTEPDATVRGALPTALRRAESWPALPATAEEGTEIAKLFQAQYPKGDRQELSRANASEANVRRSAPRFQFLHIATHGFFADPSVKAALQTSENDRQTSGIDRVSERTVAGYHPGLLCGIVLAGANAQRDRAGDDGILTALEVGELDLSRVKLVTLSACGTGLGATAGSEGTLGLQRAFQVAGAHTTITSLWKVRDEATKALMIAFYRNLWEEKLPVLEALHRAQLDMLHHKIPNAEPTNAGSVAQGRGLSVLDNEEENSDRLSPSYWAAFVLSGDWR